MKKILNKKIGHVNLKEGIRNFEGPEDTCFYTLKNRNGFLKGKSYGEALYSSLEKHNIKKFSHVLEIGRQSDFLRVVKEKKKFVDHTFLDFSSLDFTEISYKHEEHYKNRYAYDLVLANEMMNDLEIRIVQQERDSLVFGEKISTIINSYLDSMRTPLVLPVGLIDLLKDLAKNTSSEVTIVLSEHFTKHGGGTITNPQGHKDFCFNIYLVMDIIRALGFEIESYPLIDFLDFDLNYKPLSREITSIFHENFLGLESIGSPMVKLKLLEGQDHLFSNASWINKFSNYSFLVLKKKKTFEWFGELNYCQAVLSKNVAIIAQEEDHYLLRSSPHLLMLISEVELKIIKLIKKGMSVSDLFKHCKKFYFNDDVDRYVLEKLHFWLEKGIITLHAT